MDDRIDDLRQWWDRTRRRRLKPGLQSVVGRVRSVVPTPAGPAPVQAPEPSAPPDATDAAASDAPVVAHPTRDPDRRPAAEAGMDGEAEAEGTAMADGPDVRVAVPDDPGTEVPTRQADLPLLAAEPEPVADAAPMAAGDDPDNGDVSHGSIDRELPEEAGVAPETAAPASDGSDDDPARDQPEPRSAAGVPSASDDDGSPPLATAAARPVAELTWAAPGTAPWETPSPDAAPAPDPEEAAPDAAPAPDPEEAAPDPEVAALDAAPTPQVPPVTDDARPVAGDAPMVAEAPTPPPVSPDAGSSNAADPWAGITWSAGEQPAPWSGVPAAADDDPLGLDEDQQRWLGRDVTMVDSIGRGYGAQLGAAGIRTLQDLLLRGATRRGRQEIADATGISGKLIMRWVNNADLFRIRGVGTQYADLLEAAGVDTVVELALRRPDNLTARLATVNEMRSLVRQVPTEAQVADWIRQARELPRIVAY